jgi:UDP-3-O-[3-hydroxymyristoyl] glucosamine N-acyltransferase
MGILLAELATQLGAQLRGDGALEITGVAAPERAGPGDLSFVAERKYLKLLESARPGALLISVTDAGHFDGNALIVDNPHVAFARAANLLFPPEVMPHGIHASASVDSMATVAPTAWVGPLAVVEAHAIVEAGAYIGPGCYIGESTRVGSRTRLVERVSVLHHCVVGEDCIVWPGVVIGSDGFGYARDGARWVKVPQLGRVVIGRNVEIGANTTVDRGAIDDTVIGDGVKIDNLVQVAHNVRIGENTAIAGCVGIAGSAVIGRRCALGGQVGVAGHLEITDDVTVLGTSLVASSITKPGVYSSSIKAEPAELWRRNAARLRKLDEMADRLRRIEKQIEEISGRIHSEPD